MESKEKFYLLKVLVITESKEYKEGYELHDLEKHEHISIEDCMNDIEKDLDKLERIELIIKDYEKYKSKPYRPAEDYIRLIKEVFG